VEWWSGEVWRVEAHLREGEVVVLEYCVCSVSCVVYFLSYILNSIPSNSQLHTNVYVILFPTRAIVAVLPPHIVCEDGAVGGAE
jgi:hypothetical protein